MHHKFGKSDINITTLLLIINITNYYRMLKSHYFMLQLQSQECICVEIKRPHTNATLHYNSLHTEYCILVISDR